METTQRVFEANFQEPISIAILRFLSEFVANNSQVTFIWTKI